MIEKFQTNKNNELYSASEGLIDNNKIQQLIKEKTAQGEFVTNEPIPLNVPPKTIPILIEILKENYEQKKYFQTIKRLSLTQLISLANAIDGLLLFPQHSQNISKEIASYLTKMIDSTPPILDQNLCAELQNFTNPIIASLISQELTKKHKIDAYLLKPYNKQLINNPEINPVGVSDKKGRLVYYDDTNAIKIYFSSDGTLYPNPNYSMRFPCNKIIIQKQEKEFTTSVNAETYNESRLQVNTKGSCIISKAFIGGSIVFNADDNTFKEVQPIGLSFQYGCFASNDSIYIGNAAGYLYHMNIADLNPKLLGYFTDTSYTTDEPEKKGVITAITNDKNYTTHIICTLKTVFIKTAASATFKVLPIIWPNSSQTATIKQALLSPSGQFLYINKEDTDEQNDPNTLYLCDLTKPDNQAIQTAITTGSQFFEPWKPSWTSDNNLLIIGSFGWQPEQESIIFGITNDVRTLYIFINPHSHNSWVEERQRTITTISANATQAIEEDPGHIRTNFYRTTLVDKNIKKTLAFLENPQQGLLGVVLLNYIIQKAKSDTQPNAFFTCLASLDQNLQEIYNSPDYIPQEVKNVLEAQKPQSWYSSFKNITFAGTRNKLYEYQVHLLFGAAATAIGIAAAYKVWASRGK